MYACIDYTQTKIKHTPHILYIPTHIYMHTYIHITGPCAQREMTVNPVHPPHRAIESTGRLTDDIVLSRQYAPRVLPQRGERPDWTGTPTFFRSFPLMWQSRLTPSKHMASRRPFPSIFITWAYSGQRREKDGRRIRLDGVREMKRASQWDHGCNY